MKNSVIRTIGLLALGFWHGQVSAQNYIPPVFPGTGPYHRVYSDSAYSYMSANVYLPGSSQIHLVGSDTPYVYTGGWGLNGAGAVDAGFQYSPTYNNWALFAGGAGYSQQGAGPDRFSASQTVSLSFAVVAAGANITDLIVTATGLDGGNFSNGYVGNGQIIMESVTLAVNTANTGWVAGGSNTLKRMTSIAQSPQNLTDGSYINGVVWSNVMLGQTSANAVAWSGGGSQSYPSTPGVVSVNYIDAANETDSINLGPLTAVPEPRSWVMLATGQVMGLGYYGWRRWKGRRSTVARST
jgi:hypothetical protein